MMPVDLYLKLSKVILDYYRGHNLSSKLCEDFINVMCPICEKIDKGEYDMKRK